MTLTELESLSTLLRDETSSGAITATRLGNILLGIKSIFVTEESTHTDLQTQINTKASTTSLSSETSARQSADTTEANARAAADTTLKTIMQGLEDYTQKYTVTDGEDTPVFMLGHYNVNNYEGKTSAEILEIMNQDFDKLWTSEQYITSEDFTYIDSLGNERRVPLGLVCADYLGTRMFLINIATNIASGQWTQIALNASFALGSNITYGSSIYCRKHSGSSWGNWTQMYAPYSLWNTVAQMKTELNECEDDALPSWSSIFLAGDRPVNHIRYAQIHKNLVDSTAGDDDMINVVMFCTYRHKEGKGTYYWIFNSEDKKYLKKYNATTETVPEEILRAFGEAEATTEYAGLMSAEQVAEVNKIADKADAATDTTEVWNSAVGPSDNYTYNLGVYTGNQNTMILSTDDMTPSKCPNGTMIFFTCPTEEAVSICYKEGTLWTSEEKPTTSAGCSYCISIINGAYSIQQLNKV